MREIIISVTTVVLVTCLILLFSCEAIKGSIADKNRDEVEIQVSEYRREKRELENELKTLEINRDKVVNGIFRLMMLINKVDDVFINDIYPLFNENNIVATLCFDVDTLPGESSIMSMEMYTSLIKNGWQTAFYYDGNMSIEDWFNNYDMALTDLEFDVPSVVVMNEEHYNIKNATELYKLGFTDIIVKRIKQDVNREDVDGGARIIDSVGWYTFAASDLIKVHLPQNGDIAFSIGGDDIEEAYEPEQFSRMIIAINELVDKEKMFFTTPLGAEEYKHKLRDEALLTKDEYEEKKAKLENRIAELESLIQEKYDEYIDGE